MDKGKKYIKKSPEGRFFLYTRNSEYSSIDLDKKTKLWLSTDYLLKESIKDNPIYTLNQIEEMIQWNLENENYKECAKLQNLKNKHFGFAGLK
jgi:hypothetical protein